MASPATLYNTQATYLASVEEQVTADLKAGSEQFNRGEMKFERDYGLVFGKALWHARKRLADAGYGQLSKMLDKLCIPRSTAYYWIEKFEVNEGIKEEKPAKVKAAPAVAPVKPAVEPVDIITAIADIQIPDEVQNAPEYVPPTKLVSQGEVELSDTKKLQALFEGTGIILKASTVKDGLESCQGKFNLIGLTEAQCEKIAKILKA